MKRIHIVGFYALLCLTLSGCFNTDLVAPLNRNVTLLSVEEPATYHTEYRNWYLFGGILPIKTIQPEEIIAQENLVEVRVQTVDTISDGIITFLTAMIFLGVYPQTVVIDGNPGPVSSLSLDPPKANLNHHN